jgi:hypothetical protein
MINYRYSINKDTIKSAKNFFVTVSLPEGFSLDGKKARLYSPDLSSPVNIKIHKVGATSARFKIPRLKYYDLLVIE